MSDIVIVGGGLAGGAAATLLGRAGLRPLLLERTREPHDKVCGEFLSAEGVRMLAGLGIDAAALGAPAIDRLRFSAGRRSAVARLPFTGRGLTRRRVDEVLLETAAQAGAKVARGVTVRGVEGGRLDTSAGEMDAGALLLASGKHEVRGERRAAAGAIDGMIGFKRYLQLAPAETRALDGWIEVTLFEGGYAGLQLVEDGIANLCLAVDAAHYAALGSWDALFERLGEEPALATRLAGAEPLGERPLSIARVPYGFVHDGRGSAYRLGDQAAVIPSYCGDGMSIALHSAALAARALGEGAGAAAYHRRLQRDVARPVRLATALQRMGSGRLGRGLVMAGLGVWPGAMRLVARATRVA